jgi:hypothetical protein
MFYGCKKLKYPPNILPAERVNDYCYMDMFNGCDLLEYGPEIFATTLSKGCYQRMFKGCSGLTIPPELKATKVKSYCYDSMFENCVKLISSPSLPATNLSGASNCYSRMFMHCTNLSNAPTLPAKVLETWCYTYMFGDCFSLIKAPTLPAENIVSGCYVSMFSSCSGITEITILATTYEGIQIQYDADGMCKIKNSFGSGFMAQNSQPGVCYGKNCSVVQAFRNGSSNPYKCGDEAIHPIPIQFTLKTTDGETCAGPIIAELDIVGNAV